MEFISVDKNSIIVNAYGSLHTKAQQQEVQQKGYKTKIIMSYISFLKNQIKTRRYNMIRSIFWIQSLIIVWSNSPLIISS